MKSKFKKLILIVGAISMSISLTAFASNKGNWTETFNLKNGHWIQHTPTHVTLDGYMTAGKGIHMHSMNINIDVETDSTREEFVDALVKSGMYPA